MNKKLIRLTENDIHNIIKETVNNVLNEADVINRQFSQAGIGGSFETALVDAWQAASPGNKKRLENAFPEFFPSEAMYGNDNEPFDFREFPTKQHYDDFYKQWQNRNK